jgi:hypothetical protein
MPPEISVARTTRLEDSDRIMCNINACTVRIECELNTVLQTVSRQGIRLRNEVEFLEQLYDFDWCHHSKMIEVHVWNLLRKLNMDGINPL